jgi:hypothetical protein
MIQLRHNNNHRSNRINRPLQSRGNEMETREIPIEVTRNGKVYEIVVEMRGEWSGHYRPATRLDPEEFAEFNIHDFAFLSAHGLLDDVVAENSSEAFQWIRMANPFSEDDRFEALDIEVEFGGKTLEIIYDRKTPFEAFKLWGLRLFIFELEDYCIEIMNQEEGA